MVLTKKGYIKRLIDGASNNLLQFSNKCTTKPAFLCVICGMIIMHIEEKMEYMLYQLLL